MCQHLHISAGQKWLILGNNNIIPQNDQIYFLKWTLSQKLGLKVKIYIVTLFFQCFWYQIDIIMVIFFSISIEMGGV